MKLRFAIGTTGLIVCGMAIFAKQIGLDNDSVWGKGRILLLGFGLLLILINIALILFPDKLGKTMSDFILKVGKREYSTQVYFYAILTTMIVIASYFWFLSPSFKLPSNSYYSQLAVSFKENHLFLPEQPSPELLALQDPYDYELRKQANVEFPWDVSLYKGRFYIYWGAAPSLILSVLSEKTLAHIGDQHLVFAFICGLFLYFALFTISIWLRFSRRLPSWMIGLVLLAIGLSAPATMMLGRPRIYEAAVIGCQFFFIGGCYWAYSALSNDATPSPWKLTLAGFHWAFAFGTRAAVLPAIALVVVATLVYVWNKVRTITSRDFISAFFAIGLPMLIALVCTSWYNWVRFDSIFETGMRYQLLFVDYGKFGSLFSPGLIGKNFINYFVRTYDIQSKFPFIFATEDTVSNNKMAGLAFTSPYLLFALSPIIGYLYAKLASRNPAVKQNRTALEKWLVAALTGASLSSLLVILSYFFTSMNYAEDFMPSVYLLATVFLGQGYESLNENDRSRKVYIFIAVGLLAVTVISGILIALPGRR
jgi:hypothetical protein